MLDPSSVHEQILDYLSLSAWTKIMCRRIDEAEILYETLMLCDDSSFRWKAAVIWCALAKSDTARAQKFLDTASPHSEDEKHIFHSLERRLRFQLSNAQSSGFHPSSS